MVKVPPTVLLGLEFLGLDWRHGRNSNIFPMIFTCSEAIVLPDCSDLKFEMCCQGSLGQCSQELVHSCLSASVVEALWLGLLARHGSGRHCLVHQMIYRRCCPQKTAKIIKELHHQVENSPFTRCFFRQVENADLQVQRR